MLLHHGCCDPQIGGDCDSGSVLADGKADRIFSIMRYRKGMDGQIADMKRLAAFKRFDFMQTAKSGGSLVGFWVDVNRQFVTSGKNTDALDMIAKLAESSLEVGSIVGTVYHDQRAGLSGRTGPAPDMVPVQVELTQDDGHSRQDRACMRHTGTWNSAQ